MNMKVTTSRKGKKIFNSENRIIIAAMVPCILSYLVFSGFPMVYAFYLSFQSWTVGESPEFLGFQNYLKALIADPLFYKALKNTFFYSFTIVALGTTVALLVALLVNHAGKLAGVFRTVYFIPVVTSLVAASVIWTWLYQPSFGLFNQILHLIHGPKMMWLESPSQALPSVMIMMIWKNLGFTMVIFLAGLQGIPQTFYEAAMIDGANRWQLFRRITIPLLKPTMTFVLVIGVIGSLQAFTEMFVMAQGGPLHATRTIVYHLYERAFEYFQLGYASATAIILFIIIMIFTYFQLRLLRTTWEY